jgi:hypothetical protein
MRCGEGIQAGVEPRITAIWSASMIRRLSRGVTAVGSWTGLMLDRPAAGELRPGTGAGGGLGWGCERAIARCGRGRGGGCPVRRHVGSALTCQEFAAVGSAGFEPVGQVFGAAVFAAGSAGGSSCPGASGSAGGGMPAPPAAQAAGLGDAGSSGLLVEAMYQARDAAIDRMTAQCAALGARRRRG